MIWYNGMFIYRWLYVYVGKHLVGGVRVLCTYVSNCLRIIGVFSVKLRLCDRSPWKFQEPEVQKAGGSWNPRFWQKDGVELHNPRIQSNKCINIPRSASRAEGKEHPPFIKAKKRLPSASLMVVILNIRKIARLLFISKKNSLLRREQANFIYQFCFHICLIFNWNPPDRPTLYSCYSFV